MGRQERGIRSATRDKSALRMREAHKFVHTSRGICRDCGLGEEDLVHQSRAKSNDSVNHPVHYCADATHEVAAFLAAWGLESDALLWNVVKYIARHGKKGDALEDLQKARWYLD